MSKVLKDKILKIRVDTYAVKKKIINSIEIFLGFNEVFT